MLPALIPHGRSEFPLTTARVLIRPNGLDSVTQEWFSANPLAFANGGRFPGLPNFYLNESESSLEPSNLPSQIRLRGEGLADGKDREEQNELIVTDEGWDQGPVTFLTLNPDAYARGAVHPRIPTLWALEVRKSRLTGPRNSQEGVWRVAADCKGIIPQDGGLPKGRKRRITVGNQVISSSDIMALVNAGFDGEGDPFPFWNKATGTYTGWSPGRFTALDSSRVQVTDTFLTWDPPPTDILPGHFTPENPPPVKDIFSVPWFSTSGFVWNWPWGWSIKGINAEPLLEGMAGTPYLTTLVTEYVPRAVPK